MRKKRKISFINSPSDVPIIEFIISDGTSGRAIIDSGSETTLFDMGFVKEHKKSFVININKEQINLVGIQNSNSQLSVKASCALTFGTLTSQIQINDAVIVSLNDVNAHIINEYGEAFGISAILGSDFLVKNNMKLDFESKELLYNDDISRK